MIIFTQPAKSMLAIGTLFLAGCAATSTLEFAVPKDKVAAFNECLVPLELQKLRKNKDDKFWLNDLGKYVQDDLRNQDSLAFLAESLQKIIDMHYANVEKLNFPEGGQLLRVPFDMHIQKFPFIDSKMVDVVEELLFSVNLSSLLQSENSTVAKKEGAPDTQPGRVAKALKKYLLAYFRVNPNKDGETGFISRDGTKFQFPVHIDSSSINKVQAINSVDHSQVGADIIRIILEAIRDGSLNACERLFFHT